MIERDQWIQSLHQKEETFSQSQNDSLKDLDSGPHVGLCWARIRLEGGMSRGYLICNNIATTAQPPHSSQHGRPHPVARHQLLSNERRPGDRSDEPGKKRG